MSIFGGLYKYLKGNTYNSRLKEMLKKALQEVGEKNGGSAYGDVLNTEPLSAIELIYVHIIYEKQIRQFFSSLPLKSLRKIYETDVHLKPLDAVAMDPVKEQQLQKMIAKETSIRQALARWPQKQREAYEKLEYFEINNEKIISQIIRDDFNTFNGAEDYGNATHINLLTKIDKITTEEISRRYGVAFSKDQLALLKQSLRETMRDYQIFNNTSVRSQGLTVVFVNAVTGFDIAKDEAFAKAKKVK